MKMWLDVNKLSLNIDKTNFIIFKSPCQFLPDMVSIKIGNFPIKTDLLCQISWSSS